MAARHRRLSIDQNVVSGRVELTPIRLHRHPTALVRDVESRERMSLGIGMGYHRLLTHRSYKPDATTPPRKTISQRPDYEAVVGRMWAIDKPNCVLDLDGELRISLWAVPLFSEVSCSVFYSDLTAVVDGVIAGGWLHAKCPGGRIARRKGLDTCLVHAPVIIPRLLAAGHRSILD